MTNFKFRAWWVKDEGEEIEPMMVDNEHIFNYVDPLRAIEDGEIIVMQYTGLKDKNGKEIYEGDIVRTWGGECYQGVWEHDDICIVKWCSNGFDLITEKGYGLGWGFADCFEYIEVIGNVYENSELLKEVNK